MRACTHSRRVRGCALSAHSSQQLRAWHAPGAALEGTLLLPERLSEAVLPPWLLERTAGLSAGVPDAALAITPRREGLGIAVGPQAALILCAGLRPATRPPASLPACLGAAFQLWLPCRAVQA